MIYLSVRIGYTWAVAVCDFVYVIGRCNRFCTIAHFCSRVLCMYVSGCVCVSVRVGGWVQSVYHMRI